MESEDGIVEIKSPDYVKEEVKGNLSALYDADAIDGNKVEWQYTICGKEGNKTYWRLYVSSGYLWIASYVDNTADGSEIIMSIYRLTK
ncbi:hypothetical protein [Lutispora thermophila]|uniref:Uncharacterized protein n=1 Tax=Lutispora thermophila DSM 19022 TaxID=1122184 RepID=A0A1M6BD47_9FIRM|nr:hypothetical protein [Lutispora thermophila]SHI46607.1 hypothetical protein SAMN02745176_00400 [Lutispora thermophila DSM 19022]